MKSNTIFTCKPLITSCLLLALTANAEEKMHDYSITIRAGLDQPTVSNNNYGISGADRTYVASVEAAKKINELFSLGLEYSYRGKSNFNINKDTYGSATATYSWAVSSNVFMLNANVDLMKDSLAIPFIKVGLGTSINKSYDYLVNIPNQQYRYPGKTKNSFAWQAGLGVNIPYNKQIDTELSYTYLDRGKVETQAYYYRLDNRIVENDARSIKLQDHTIMVGIKVKL